jgi:hypothetical protein
VEGSEAAQAAARGLTGDCQDMPSHAPRMSCYTGATSTTYATRLKFDEVLQKAGHNFVGENAGDATDPWPLVSFAATPYGNPALSERTLQSRNQYIRQVYMALGTTLPFVPYRWLGDCDKVLVATQKAYPSSRNSFKKAAEAIVCLCAATSQKTLRETYETRYALLIAAMEEPGSTE